MAAVVFIVGGAPLARIDVGSTLDTFVGNKLGTVEIATVATGEQARHFAPQRRAESESPSRAHHRAEVAVQVATAAQAEIARWATGRFTEAGLELPALSLTFHEGREKCGGNHGSFRREDGVAQVEICNAVPHVVLHELAHAWEAAAVDDRTRRGFIDALGLAAWNSPEVAWSDRGIERAANTIALVLNWEANPMSDTAVFEGAVLDPRLGVLRVKPKPSLSQRPSRSRRRSSRETMIIPAMKAGAAMWPKLIVFSLRGLIIRDRTDGA